MKVKQLTPLFLSALPPTSDIREGFLYISMAYRTINLRCPCGCGGLTPISLHPTRWSLIFDGNHVSIVGPQNSEGSIWNPQLTCGSHYLIRRSTVVPCDRLSRILRHGYFRREQSAMLKYRGSLEVEEPVPPTLKRVGRWLRRVTGRE